MRKFLTYSGLLVGSLVVVLLFVTATTYLQLAIAVILYPVIAYFAVKIFRPRIKKVQTQVIVRQPAVKTEKITQEVYDDDKRTFLKLVGATGVFFFISSLLGRRVDNLLLNPQSSSPPIPNADANQSSASLASNGYSISEIDDGATTYYGFTNRTGGWLIMKEDTDSNSFRYAKGNSGFPGSWSNRTTLKYDYYYNLF